MKYILDEDEYDELQSKNSKSGNDDGPGCGCFVIIIIVVIIIAIICRNNNGDTSYAGQPITPRTETPAMKLPVEKNVTEDKKNANTIIYTPQQAEEEIQITFLDDRFEEIKSEEGITKEERQRQRAARKAMKKQLKEIKKNSRK